MCRSHYYGEELWGSYHFVPNSLTDLYLYYRYLDGVTTQFGIQVKARISPNSRLSLVHESPASVERYT